MCVLNSSDYTQLHEILTLCAYVQQGYVFDHVGLCRYICTIKSRSECSMQMSAKFKIQLVPEGKD